MNSSMSNYLNFPPFLIVFINTTCAYIGVVVWVWWGAMAVVGITHEEVRPSNGLKWSGPLVLETS